MRKSGPGPFSFTRGSEIAKTRPVVVVSPDEMNCRLETVVICPLTSQLHPHWASRVACVCAGTASDIDNATTKALRQTIALLYVRA
ncbi:MAG: type II toxin-antitoxin system PemK/MazF family toxin [Burkholderiales bacterium]|nr:type II toxin-antitoxin system PemK/MazF family toxin [Burkholderiales bacterium]